MKRNKRKKRQKNQPDCASGKPEKTLGKVRAAALELLQDPHFFFRVGQQFEAMGVVGECKNRVIAFLAAVTKDFDPVHVIIKGPTASGKNEVLRGVVRLAPPECVVTRTSMTPKALAYGSQSFRGKILYLQEYRSGRDRNYLTRVLQSEGGLSHEHTVVKGRSRTTQLAGREGSPVILSTTTDENIYPDDETRFLSLRTDESADQTRQVIRAKFQLPQPNPKVLPLNVWHEVFRVLAEAKPVFKYPDWLVDLAEWIPSSEPRARRDAGRFVSLLRAVALCRSFSDDRHSMIPEVEINFADYCVAHEILHEAFASTFRGAHPHALQVAEAVRRLRKALKRPVTVKDIAGDLSWELGVTYKWVKKAVKLQMLAHQEGTREMNTKPLIPGSRPSAGFLPEPSDVLRRHPQIGLVRYGHPLTGQPVEVARPKHDANEIAPKDRRSHGNAHVSAVSDSANILTMQTDRGNK